MNNHKRAALFELGEALRGAWGEKGTQNRLIASLIHAVLYVGDQLEVPDQREVSTSVASAEMVDVEGLYDYIREYSWVKTGIDRMGEEHVKEVLLTGIRHSRGLMAKGPVGYRTVCCDAMRVRDNGRRKLICSRCGRTEPDVHLVSIK